MFTNKLDRRGKAHHVARLAQTCLQNSWVTKVNVGPISSYQISRR